MLFEKELKVISDGKELLEKGAFVDTVAEEKFSTLLKSYEKLYRSEKRLVRLSDRSQEKLNSLAKSLDKKNTMLEGLSVKLSKYLSPQIYNSIFTGEQDVSLTTKRKKLTVFFSDLKDFTKTTEGLQPEDLTGVLNNYFSEMSTIALAHGATIDKFIGDAMMIFFGDPESKGVKEDASACVRMAVEMQRRMEDLQQSWRDSGMENPWEMRIGINTGYCNVGNFGSVDRMDYTIIGGEVNLSARLEGKSDPGGILMSYETYALVKDLIRAEEQKPMTVKGIAREIRPFAVTNIYENLDDERRFIRRETEAMQLAVDLDKLTGEQRTKAIYELEGVLERMKREA